MKKKALSLALALVMCLSLTVPAMASEENYFSSNGIPVSQEPPKDSVFFTYAMYEGGDVPREEADYAIVDGVFGVLSCTTVPADKVGYQTTTLELCISMDVIPDFPRCVWSSGIYDYYTGFGLFTDKMDSLDMEYFVTKPQLIYQVGDETYTIDCTIADDWDIGEWYYDESDEVEYRYAMCYRTITITAPTDYDGMVFKLFNRTDALPMTSDSDEVEYVDNENNALCFRFGPHAPEEPDQPEQPLAKAGNQDIEIDGNKVAFQTYMLADANGNGTNYVKLRDIAHVLNGTAAQFSVGYDRQNASISAVTGAAYKDTGTEMDTPFAGADKEYVQSQLTIVVDGTPVQLDAITLTDANGGGYNYFKLRDLGDALGFTVGYSRDRGVYIETD